MLFFITALAYEMEIKPLSIPTIQDKLKIRKLIYYRPTIYRRYKIICTKRRKHTTPNPYKPQILWEDTLIPGTTYGTFKPKLYIENDTVFAGGGGGGIVAREPVIAVKIYLADGSKVQRKLIHWGSSAGMGFCRTPSKNHFLLGDSYDDTPLILTKLSPNLDSLWTKTYADSVQASGIAADNLGRIIITGNIEIGGDDMWVVYCLDEDGNIIWGDTVSYGECGSYTQWTNDYPFSVACDKDNNIYVTGTVDDSLGNPHPRIIKWNPEGQVEWYWVWSYIGTADGNLNIWNGKGYIGRAPPLPSFFEVNLQTGEVKGLFVQTASGKWPGLQAVRRVGPPQSRSANFLYVCGVCGDSGYIAKTDTLGNLIWECFIYPDWISNLAYVDFYTFNISPDQARIVAAGYIHQTTAPAVRYVVCINNPSDTLPPNLTIFKPQPNQSYDTLSYLVYLLSDSTGYENQGWQGKPRKLEIKLIKKEADTLIDTIISEPLNFAKDSLPLGLTAPKDTGNYNLIIKATDWFYNTTRKELSFSIKVSTIYETRKEITKLHFKSPARKLIINLEKPEKITIWDVSGRVVKQCYTRNLIFKPQKSGIFFFKIENQPQIHKIILIK